MNSNKEMLSLGKLIASLRMEKGYSQRRFAQISGLSNTTISRIENGETHNPGIDTLSLLAKHLDYDEARLINLVNSKSSNNIHKKAFRLKYLRKPVKAIKRYSSVCTSNSEQLQAPPQPEACGKPIAKAAEAEPINKVMLKGMRLITLRLEHSITQKELADALGMDKTLISQYEGEIIKPDYNTIQRIADFFEVSVDYLISNQKEEPRTVSEHKTTNTASAPKKDNTVKPEYISLAKELQDAAIDPKDVRAFIDMINKYKGL